MVKSLGTLLDEYPGDITVELVVLRQLFNFALVLVQSVYPFEILLLLVKGLKIFKNHKMRSVALRENVVECSDKVKLSTLVILMVE